MDSPPPKIRAFIAVYPGPDVASRLESLQSDLQKRLSNETIRWARAGQIHITSQFLGYIEVVRLADFESAISSVSEKHSSFQLAVEKLGCFPSRKSPRVLWAGLAGEIAALESIKADLDSALAPLGYVPEKREFHPHLTLARIGELKRKEIEQLTREIVSHEAAHVGEWRVEKIDLIQSVLSPAGAKYSLLRFFPLAVKK